MLTLQELDVFRAVVSEGSVSGAGRHLNLSQPSVSRVLAELERKLSFALFRRRSKGMAPTPEALVFLKEVDETYAALSSLEQIAREIAQGRYGALSFVVNYAASLEISPNALARMNAPGRNIAITYQCKSSDWIIEFARTGMIKTGVANIEHMPKGMRTRFTSATPHMCVLSADDPLACESGSLSLDRLHGRRIIGLTGAVANTISLHDPASARTPPVTAEVSLSAIHLAERLGATPIVDAFTAHYWTCRTSTVARPVSDLPSYLMAIFALSGARLSALDEELQSLLEDEIRVIEGWAGSQ